MSSGSSGATTVTQKSGPPDYAKQNVIDLNSAAARLAASGGPQVYPGSTVAAQSPLTQQGIAATAARATNGSPLNAAAGGYIQNTLGANFNQAGNPQLDAVYKNVASHVIPSVDAQFSLAGRYGPNAAQNDSLAQGLTNAYAPFALQQFQGNQQLQANAAQQAPQIAGQDYTDLGALLGAGQQQDQYNQSLMSDAVQRWQAQQQRPFDAANWYAGILNGSPYSTGKSTQQVPSAGLGGALGGFLGSIL